MLSNDNQSQQLQSTQPSHQKNGMVRPVPPNNGTRERKKATLWRRSIVGYLLVFPVVGLSLGLTALIERLLPGFLFPGSVLFCALSIFALIWGPGPTLLLVVLGYLGLDYFFINPHGSLAVLLWPDGLQMIPFLFAALLITLVARQLERSRQQAEDYASRLEKVNQQLEDEHQLKDRFFSIVSHELKTPVTTIRGQAQLLTRRITRRQLTEVKSASVVETLQKVNEETVRLVHLIDELQDVSRNQAGKMSMDFQPCDIGPICQEVVDDQRLLSGRTISLSLSSRLPGVYGDRDRLLQVMTNLVNNALKYSPPETSVEVNVMQGPTGVHIEVRDYGQGIDKEHLAHIFELFYRSPDTAKRTRGLGLGLAIVKDIVERHHGSIWCDSQPGKGSTFFVELPGVNSLQGAVTA